MGCEKFEIYHIWESRLINLLGELNLYFKWLPILQTKDSQFLDKQTKNLHFNDLFHLISSSSPDKDDEHQLSYRKWIF